jgi:membrane protein
MSPRAIGSVIAEAGQQFMANKGPRLGAALAFYTVISLTPLLVVAVGLAGQVFGAEAARGEIVGQIEWAVGREAAVLVETALREAGRGGQGRLATIVGIAALLLGASTVFVHLKGALNDIWGVTPAPSEGGLLGAVSTFLKTRVLVFAVVLGVGVLLLGSLLANAALEASVTFFEDYLPLPAGTLRLVNAGVTLALVTVLFAYVYRAVPDVWIAWREVWFGAFVTALLFTLGRQLIALYLGRASVGSAFGAASSFVVLLVWVYYSTQIFFFGAELTKAYAHRHGSQWRVRSGFQLDEWPESKEKPEA